MNDTTDMLKSELRVGIFPVDIFKVPGLTNNEKLVYIVLQSFTNAHENTAFPSYSTIAKLASISRQTAITCVKSLIEKGLIIKEKRFIENKNGQIERTSNLYVIRMPKVPVE